MELAEHPYKRNFELQPVSVSPTDKKERIFTSNFLLSGFHRGTLHDASHELNHFSIWNHEDGRYTMTESSALPSRGADAIKSWLQSRDHEDTTRFSLQSKVLGGIRVCYQRWATQDLTVREGRLPYSPQELNVIVKTLGFSQSCFNELCTGYYIVPQPHYSTSQGNRTLSIVCQSPPSLRRRFSNVILSYDLTTNITTALLGEVVEEPYLSIVDLLRKTPWLAIHPFLIPLLVLGTWSDIFKESLTESNQTLSGTMVKSRLLDAYLQRVYGGESKPDDAINIHERRADLENEHPNLIENHIHLTNSVSEFTAELLDACMTVMGPSPAGFDQLWMSNEGTENAHLSLQIFLKRLQSFIKADMHARERLLSRLEMQQKVKEDNLVNYQIARDSKRDSSAMKTLALLGLLFLPGTAIATIFSMSPFFKQGDNLEVVSNFWIYWVVVIPITTCIVITWYLWDRRQTEDGVLDVERGRKRL